MAKYHKKKTHFIARKRRNLKIITWIEKRAREININDLPPGVLITIFSFLPLEDLYLNVKLVCRYWYIISKSPCLWSSITVGPEISTEILMKLLHYAPKLKNLEIENRLDAGYILKQVHKCNKNIKNIKLHDCCGSEKRINVPSAPLCNILLRCPYLESISMRGSRFISCKFFRLLATRNMILEKRKRNIDHSRRSKTIQYFGGARKKQMHVFLQARLSANKHKLALLRVKSNLNMPNVIVRQEHTLKNEEDIENILNSFRF